MPVEFALCGLVALAAALVAARIAGLAFAASDQALRLIALLFVATLVAGAVPGPRWSTADVHVVHLVQAIAAAIGWLGLVGALCGLRRESDAVT